jgi:arylsulfatase
MVPTVLEAVGVQPPKSIRGVTQSPIEGVSFAHTFNEGDAATHHHTQYFEMFGNRAIDHNGWRAECGFPGPSYSEGAQMGRKLGGVITAEVLDDLEMHGWELYHIAEDPAEVHNVADQHPEKLRELVSLWWAEAGKYKVLPIDGSIFQRLAADRPVLTADRAQYVYYPDLAVVPAANAPKVFNRPHSITADVTIANGSEGVLLAQGGVAGGYVFYVKDGKLHYIHNYLGLQEYKVTSTEEIPQGRVELRYEFEPTGAPDLSQGKGAPGRGQLYIDGRLVGNAEFDTTVPIIFGIEGLSCGYDFGEAVTEDYHTPFRFSGTLHQVTVDVSGELIQDEDSTVRQLMARQ